MGLPTITATVGSASANSYVTEAESDTIAATFFPPLVRWTAAPQERRRPCLIEATEILDRLRPAGTGPASSTQARVWPRLDVAKRNGGVYAATELPADLQRAQVRLAAWLEEYGETAQAATMAGDLSSISLGSEISMSFGSQAGAAESLSEAMRRLILPILGPLVRTPQPRIARG